MARDIRLGIDADSKGAQRGLLAAAKSFLGLEKAMDRTSDEAKELDRRMEITGHKVKELAREFARASNEIERTRLDKAFRGEVVALARLRAVRKELHEVSDEAGQAARKLALVGGAGAAGAGAKSGAAFAGLFSRAVGSPLTLALVAGASAAAPLIGSVVGAALVGGAGAGGVGVGIAGAFTDPKVKAAAKEFGGTVAGDFKAIVAETFVQPTLAGIGKAGKAWRAEIRPEVEATLRASAKLVDPLVDAGIGFTKGLLPGIRSMVEDAGPIFDVLGKDLPALGRSLGRTFEEVGKHSEAISVGLHDAFIAIEGTVAAAGFLVSYLSESYAFTRKIAGFTGGPLALIDASNTKVAATAIAAAAEAVVRLRGEVHGTTGAFRSQTAVLRELADAYRDAFDRTKSVEQANIDLERSFDDFRESIKENGKSLDVNTEKGRSNREALLGLASAAIASRDAAIRNGESYKSANEKFATARQKIMDLATALGASKEEARKLIAQLLGIQSKAVTVKVKFVSDFERYRSPSLAPGQYIAHAKGAVAKAANGLITSKPMILFGERQTGEEAYIPRLGISRDRAAGLLGTAAGWHGMDVVPRYANVTPASGGYNAMPPPRMSGGGRLSGTLTVDPGMTSGLAREIVKMLRIEIINDGGGNVQLALGQ